MATPRVLELGQSATKQKAIDDARKTQASILKDCAKTGREPPPYSLTELIGKGSFGRVYKAARAGAPPDQQLVAVKIINIEENDNASPRAADTFKEILKEVNTIKLLNESGARNINPVFDAQLIGQSMWIVTELCAGGSVATLMRPTGGLVEKWIIPILRETAEALYWVHGQGIIHRDVKCANVLITEDGGVQLCDFGVAGALDSNINKRTTVTGTLHWMAPELFDPDPSYGTEVDIWAFGSMVYEIASGLPPNVTSAIDISTFGSQLKQHCPRLEGDKYSAQLKDLVAFCMVEDPKKRPTISSVQKHAYISGTADRFPTRGLSQLVRAYKLWENQGGIRKSLFAAGGAGNSTEDRISVAMKEEDEWKFDTNVFGDEVNDADLQAVYDAYGASTGYPAETVKPKPPRRRMPPPQIKPLKGPLEKIFDPNTLTNYEENSRDYYGKAAYRPPTEPASDLPLRNSSQGSNLRESLIDLDMSLQGSRLSRFADIGGRPFAEASDTQRHIYDGQSQSNMPEEPAPDPNRRTQDWTFPMMSPSTPDRHKPEPPLPPLPGHSKNVLSVSEAEASRLSAMSLIDLDASDPGGMSDFSRPSTSHSNSNSSVDSGSFDLEKNTFYGRNRTPPEPRHPSLYVLDDSPPSEPQPTALPAAATGPGIGIAKIGPAPRPGPIPRKSVPKRQPPRSEPIGLPAAPAPPSGLVMSGRGGREEAKSEMLRLISNMAEHLQYADAAIKGHPVRRAAHLPRDDSMPSSS